MKKLLLVAGISAAFSGFAFSEDLTFDPASFLAEVQTCASDVDPLSCGTVGEFGVDAFDAANNNALAEAGVAAATAAQATADEEAATAVANLAADDGTSPAQTLALEDLVDLTEGAATAAATTTAGAVAAQEAAEASLAGFTGDVAAAYIEFSGLQNDVQDAGLTAFAAETAETIAIADAALANAAIAAAAVTNDSALADYTAATTALAGDPLNATLQANKLTAAIALQTASADLASAEAAGAPVLAASAAATAVAEATADAFETAIEAADASFAGLGEIVGDFENNVTTNVIAAQYEVDEVAAGLAVAEAGAATADTAFATATSDSTAAAAAETAAQTVVTEAEAAVVAAQAAFDALPATATVAEITEATSVLSAAQNTAAEAVIAEAAAAVAASTAAAAVTVADAGVTASDAAVTAAQAGVDIAAASLAAANTEAAVHADYLDNDSNPAAALMDNIVSSDNNAQAIVTAVSETYSVTVVNATDIATNATGVATNVTGIATNATGIATNVTGIATNATGIATNATGVATNATGIASNTSTLAVHEGLVMQNIDNIGMNRSAINNLSADVDVLRSGVAASLALAGMPVAPGAGWGFAVGTGFFDGESAVAAGLTFRSTSSTYKFSIGNSGGETSASAGGAWNF